MILELSELDWKGPGYLGQTIGSLGWERVFIFNVYTNIMILSCSYLGNICDTVVISNLQFETKNGKK